MLCVSFSPGVRPSWILSKSGSTNDIVSNILKLAPQTCLLRYIADLPLVYLEIDIDTRYSKLEDDLFTLYVRQEFALRIPTLHYLVVSTWIWGEKQIYRWWRIIRSETPSEEPQLERRVKEPLEIKRRMWNMDRDSLLHFDINKFVA